MTAVELLAREGRGVPRGWGGRHRRDQQPPTAVEIAALREIGYVYLPEPSHVLAVYRAGFSAGREKS